MNANTTYNNPTNLYWNRIKGASYETKLALIAKLSNALMEESRDKKNTPISASSFYGVWNDNEYDETADELINHIRESRSFKNDIQAF